MVMNIHWDRLSRVDEGARGWVFLYIKGCIVSSFGTINNGCRGHVFSVSAT